MPTNIDPGQQRYGPNGIEIFGGLDPQYEYHQQRRDPYGPDVQWDINGNPINQRLPRLENAVDWQFLANQKAEQRRSALWGDAQGVLGQGIDLLQSYRPGGSAALASGLFGQRANMFAAQAQDTEAPDLMMGYRQQKQLEADKEAKRAARFNRILGGIGAVSNLVGAVTGAGQQTPPTVQGGQTQPPTAPAQAQVPGTQSGNMGPTSLRQSIGYGDQTAQSQIGQPQAPGQMGPPLPTAQATVGRGSQAPGAASGAGAPAPAPGAGPRPGGPQPPGGGGGGGGAGMAMAGNVPMSSFMPEEAAAVSMGSMPQSGGIVYPEWAEDKSR